MEPLSCHSEQPASQSNSNRFKEVTITSNKESNMNHLISVLKKLPDITFQVTSQPIFKVPKIPKLVKRTQKKIIEHESKLILEKEVLSKKQGNNIMGRNSILIDNPKIDQTSNSDLKKTMDQKFKKVDSSIPSLVKNNSNQIITKHTKTAAFEKYSHSGQENTKRTSSLNIFFNKPQNISKIKSKTVKPANEVANTSIVSYEMKKIACNDSNINNTNVKINKSYNENYKLMDISIEGKIDIVSSFHPIDFNDICIPKYDNFVEGFDKLSKNNTSSEKLQNQVRKGSLVGLESTQFSDVLDHVKTSLMLNDSSDIQTDPDFSIEGNASLDNIQNEKHININEFVDTNMNIENEVNESKIEEKSNSKNMLIVLKDKHLLQEMKSFFCDNLMETTEDQLKNSTKSLREMSTNTIENNSIAQRNKNTIKRHKQAIKDLYKKRKTDCENTN